MDRVHRSAKRHVRRRIEFAGVGEMLEQFREEHKTLPLAQALRQHLGGAISSGRASSSVAWGGRAAVGSAVDT